MPPWHHVWDMVSDLAQRHNTTSVETLRADPRGDQQGAPQVSGRLATGDRPRQSRWRSLSG